MATTKPTFANLTGSILTAPRYNFSDIEVPPGKFITGDYYEEENTVNGEGTGELLYEVLGFTDVSDGDDPAEADIVYDYTISEVIPDVGIPTSEKGAALGVATLDENEQLDVTQLPDLAITDVFVCASEAAMLALNTAKTGDVAIRTDLTKSFILADNGASVLANWKELLSQGGLTGSLTAGRVPYATGQYTVADKNTFTFDSATDTLTTGNISAVNNGYFDNGGFAITGFQTASGGQFTFGSVGYTSTPDAGLARHSAGGLKVTDGGAAYGQLYAASITVATAGGQFVGANSGVNLRLPSAGVISISSNATNGAAAPDTVLSRAAPATWQLGNLNVTGATPPVAQTLQVQSVGTTATTDLAGSDWTLRGSLGKGTSASGNIVFKVGTPQVSGTAHVANTVLTLKDVGTAGTSAPQAIFEGSVLARYGVEAVTGSKSPTAQESRELYTNKGDTDGATITLPSAVAGLAYNFFVYEAQTLTITAGSGDKIRIGSNETALAGNVTSNVVGSSLMLVAIDDTTWVAMSVVGTWSF